jgi:hypothetical protein
MRYLARAFVGRTERFAFASVGEDDHWHQFGITPIRFPLRPPPERHSAIDDALTAWAARANMGLLDHEVRISTLVQSPPPLEPELADYARSVLKDPATLRFFVRDAKLIEWFKWLENDGLLHGLTSPSGTLTESDALLAGWIAQTFVVEHPKETLGFV